MTRFTPPYADASPARITQGFHKNHSGLDMISKASWTIKGSGVPLVAPEDVEIVRIAGDGFTPNSTTARKNGWGIFMKGLESGHYHVYWHTEPYLPVNKGDIVKRGKIVAYMGNSGLVYAGGVYVPVEERYTKKGTHLHWEYMKTYRGARKGDHMDQAPLIDWNLKPTYTVAEQLACVMKVLLKMSKVLK